MKLPEKIRIGGVEYPLVWIENLNDGVRMCYGQIDYDECVIRMSTSSGTGQQHQCITLLHEILHGIRNHAGLEIEDEEAVVDMYAKGLYQVLQDNAARLFDINATKKDGEGS